MEVSNHNDASKLILFNVYWKFTYEYTGIIYVTRIYLIPFRDITQYHIYANLQN